MRCPNCGNENPPDYMFCDECGARLIGGEQAAGMPTSENEAASVGVGSTAAPASPFTSGSGIVSLPSSPSDQGDAPSYSSMGMQDSSPDAPVSTPNMDMGAGTDMGMSAATDDGNAQDSAPAPVTEDTIQPPIPSYSYNSMDSGMGASSDDSAAAAPAPTMPDVAPISAAPTSEAEPADTFEVVPVEENAPVSAPMDMSSTQSDAGHAAPAPATPAPAASAPSGGAWAADALDHLKSAQQAITSGDWGGFGQAMSTLRSILESAVAGSSAGTASQAPSMSAPSPAAPTTPTTPTPMGASSSADSGPSMATWGGSGGSPTTDNGSGAPSYPSYNSNSGQPYSSSGPAGMEAAPAYSMPVAEPQEAQPAMSATAPASTGGMAGMEDGVARLVVISTGAELSLPEQEEITVGREDPSSGIFPDVDLTPYGGEDGGVSRRHARLLHIGDDYFVEDLQSTNYTKLDGQRLPAHVRERLEDGARLDFGRVAVIFRRN